MFDTHASRLPCSTVHFYNNCSVAQGQLFDSTGQQLYALVQLLDTPDELLGALSVFFGIPG